MPLRLRVGAAFISAKVSARLSARWIEGCLHLFLCAVAGALRWLLWLLWLFFSTFTPAIMGVACFSFLTLGEQGDSSFTVALAEARVDVFWENISSDQTYQKRPTLRKYAQETSRVADCENMHSAKIILSPYSLGASPSAPGGRPAPGPRPGGVAEVSPLPRVRGEDMGEDRGVRLATCELRVVRYSLVRPTVSSDDYCTVKRTV